ncbi:MAG TPA: hypothetical protein VGF94_03660 [Kofleriaceae bacterium]|jgi:hypothetical protein
MLRYAICAAAFALTGCGRQADSTDPRSSPAPTSTKPAAPAQPAEAAKPAVPWSTDNSAALAKLQGVWLVKGFGMYGAVSAWKFDGEKVTVYSPEKKTETPDVFLFESPCAVRLDSGYGGTLVIDGDDVYLGLGGGGWKHGDVIVACMGSGTVYSTPAGCATYTKRPDWQTVETTCTRSDARFVTNEKSNYGESSLRFFNDHTLLTDQLAASKLTKLASWDAAKAAADKVAKAH